MRLSRRRVLALSPREPGTALRVWRGNRLFAVTRGSSLLFGIGSSALPLWDQEDEVAQSGARSDRVQRPAQEPYVR
jgi:hypothetical protein